MASITLKNIRKVYPGGVTAVDDFNLHIEDKQFIVLVGPSGCGKSTTLRMIAGLEEITEGEIFIGDDLVNNMPPKDRNIAMVFQNYALYPHMTAFNNMAFGLKMRKTPKTGIEQLVREASRILDIEYLLDRKPKAMSGGQRQRVALGRAMVRHPAVFLLDEPLSNLDAKLRTSMRTEIIKLHKRLGITFVYVTHDQTEAMTMGDIIVVMKDGFIQQVDTPQSLYEKPCNVFVAGFIGTPQMNFFSGVLTKEGDNYFVETHGDRLQIDPVKINDRLADYVSRKVTVGIRPENLTDRIGSSEVNPHSTITAIVDVSELMGSEVYLYLDYKKVDLIARVSSETTAKAGDEIKLLVDTRRIHLFDCDDESAII